MTTTCVYCAEPVDPDGHWTYQRIQGWEKKSSDPRRRSGSDVFNRVRLQEFACDGCVGRLKRGLSATQGTLGEAA